MHGVSQGELAAQLEQLEGPWAPLATTLEGVTRGCSRKKGEITGTLRMEEETNGFGQRCDPAAVRPTVRGLLAPVWESS